jgi:hypothetical protein
MKKMPKKKTSKINNQNPANNSTEEFLVLGHLIKYNLYLLTKSVVFSAVLAKSTNYDDAIAITNSVMTELDLDLKRRTHQETTQENLQ